MTAADLVRQLANEPTVSAAQKEAASPILFVRIRTARNLADYSFPSRCGMADRREIRAQITSALGLSSPTSERQLHHLTAFNKLQLKLLQERNVSTRAHARTRAGSAVVIDSAKNLTLMINEKDHLRTQVIRQDRKLMVGLKTLQAFDRQLEENLPLARGPGLGFYCAAPKDTGAGLQTRARLHLPALTIADRLEPIARASQKLHFSLYATPDWQIGSNACLFDVRGHCPRFGQEENFIRMVQSHLDEIERLEKETSQFLLESRPELVYDHVSRAFALLGAARLLDTQEAAANLMALRFGVRIGALPNLSTSSLDNLLTSIQPAHLQFQLGKPLSKFERDSERARIIKTYLRDAAS